MKTILGLLALCIMAFNAGRTYEYAANREHIAISQEVQQIALALEQLPVRGMR